MGEKNKITPSLQMKLGCVSLYPSQPHRSPSMAVELPQVAAQNPAINAISGEDERPKVVYNKVKDAILVISLSGLNKVDRRRSEIYKKIVEACEDWGIFQVVDHGVDAGLISDMTRLAHEFFALPSEEKLRFDMSGEKKGGFIVSPESTK